MNEPKNLMYTFSSGVYNHGNFSTSILVTNCPSIKDGYDFLSKILNSECTGASRINHVIQNLTPLRIYSFKAPVSVYLSHKSK